MRKRRIMKTANIDKSTSNIGVKQPQLVQGEKDGETEENSCRSCKQHEGQETTTHIDHDVAEEQKVINTKTFMVCETNKILQRSQSQEEAQDGETSTSKINLFAESLTHHEDLLEGEVTECEISSKQDITEKLSMAVSRMEQEIQQKGSIQLLVIDLLMWLQSTLDENNLFPENSSVNILDIVNAIPDKWMTAWKK